MLLTPEQQVVKKYIESLMTDNGGYTRETLAKLGVPWPPPKGWKVSLIRHGYFKEKDKK